MQRSFRLVVITLCLAVSAAAQGPAGDGSGPRTGRSNTFSIPDYSLWQLSADYQYNRVNLTGSAFATNGLNVDFARYFGRWFGLEGQLGLGYGNTGAATTAPNLVAKSIFVGGGPRLSYRGRGRLEPWIHGVAGMQHFRFTQTGGLLGSNTAFAGAGGGGIDLHFGVHTAVRVEVDAIFSRFFSGNQRQFQAVSGLVFNF